MTEIRFYHLQRQSVEQTLPALLKKALDAGHKILVHGRDSKQIANLDKHLWTYRPDSFLPHGTDKDPDPENQLILLSTKTDALNQANVRIELGGLDSENPGSESLICLIFEDWDEQTKIKARDTWKSLKEKSGEYTLSYWQQSESGGWVQKA